MLQPQNVFWVASKWVNTCSSKQLLYWKTLLNIVLKSLLLIFLEYLATWFIGGAVTSRGVQCNSSPQFCVTFNEEESMKNKLIHLDFSVWTFLFQTLPHIQPRWYTDKQNYSLVSHSYNYLSTKFPSFPV